MNKRLLYVFAGVVLLAAVVYTPRNNEPVRYVERQSGSIVTEQVPGERWLLWLYDNPAGELTLEALVKRKFVSAIYGKMMDSPRSKKKIIPFVTEYHIDTTIFLRKNYRTFNEFFIRKIRPSARPVDRDSLTVVSPGDGKLLVFNDPGSHDFLVKGIRFDLYSFLWDSLLARKYDHGSMVVIRLAPTDYHRFHFPVDGTVVSETPVEGYYYSVNPIALRKKTDLLWENKRDYTLIATAFFDTVVMAEVGATMVGSIVQTYSGKRVTKGEEKGYFKFGGSSIVLLFKPYTFKADRDLLVNSANFLETQICMGERIGRVFPRREPEIREAGQ